MKASVIVLAWNGIGYLEDCLGAVLSQDYPDFEAIVVDNGSIDGSADFVAERYPQVRLIRNERNLGFAGGNNVGLRAATGDVLVLLNQDTVVHAGWLGALVEALSAEPDSGIAGGKALYPDGTIQHAGGHVNERGEGVHYGYQQEDVGQFGQMRDVDYVTGATLAIARSAFETIGELDEDFSPAYYEDVDWCYRAREHGFRVVYVPQAVLTHKESSAIADMSYERMYLFQRNRLRFVFRHWPLGRLVDEFAVAERTWLEGLDEGSERLIAVMHRAYLHHLLHLADVMSWRQKLLDAQLDEADVVADALLTLRTVVPLRPARVDVRPAETPSVEKAAKHVPEDMPVPSLTAQRPVQKEVMAEIFERWDIKEQPFRSKVPVFGPLIAGFRRQWNRVSTEWYVRPMIQQQIELNARVAKMLDLLAWQAQAIIAHLNLHMDRIDQQEHDRRRLGEVLAEYIGEDGREIAELARELQQLRALLEEVAQRG